MIKTLKILIALITTVALLLVGGCSHYSGVDTPVGPSQVTPKVFMDPFAINAINGNSFTVKVYIENVTNLYFASVYLVYDPAKVNYISSTEGNFLNQGGVSTSFMPSTSENALGNGLVKRSFGISRLDNAKGGASGTGNLFSITFKAISPGTTNISFSSDTNDLGFRNVNNSDIQITVGNGTALTIN